MFRYPNFSADTYKRGLCSKTVGPALISNTARDMETTATMEPCRSS